MLIILTFGYIADFAEGMSGVYGMTEHCENQKKVTIEEIAQALGVSKTTVSRALSGKGRIGKETKEKVMAYIQQTGMAPQVREQKVTHNISLVIPERFVGQDLYFVRKCMAGVTRMAGQRGYDVLLCYYNQETNSAENLKRQLRDHKMDGVIFTQSILDDPLEAMMKQYHVPYVVIGHGENDRHLSVDNDQIGAARDMTSLLLRGGRQRIAYIGGDLNNSVNVDRVSGYQMALAEAGIPKEEGLLKTGVESQVQREDALDAVLEQHPDCILCADDSLVYDVFQKLHVKGIQIPQQIWLASLYDSPLLEKVSPGISAVHFDPEELGRIACRMLLDTLAGKEVPPQPLLGYQVVLRDTTK